MIIHHPESGLWQHPALWNALATSVATLVERQAAARVPCRVQIDHRSHGSTLLALIERAADTHRSGIMHDLNSLGYVILGEGTSNTGRLWGVVVERPGNSDGTAVESCQRWESAWIDYQPGDVILCTQS